MKKLIIAALIIALTNLTIASNWPQWRGPAFNGSSSDTNLPSTWAVKDNAIWTADLPGTSAGTPIICDGKVFVTSTDKNSKNLLALCFDITTGKELWRKKISTQTRQISRGGDQSASSPATNGKNVYFLFENGDFAAVDFSGKIIWTRKLAEEFGSIGLKFGYSSSPLVYQNKVYIQVMRMPNAENGKPQESFLLAVNPETGKDIFKVKRQFEALEESNDAYTSPIPFEYNGRKEIILIGADFITSHNPETGKEIWRYKYMLKPIKWGRIISSVTVSKDMIYGVRARGTDLFAIAAGAVGEVPEEDVRWIFDGPTPDVSTPLVYKGNVYVLDGKQKKIVTCLDAATGKEKWSAKLGGKSPYWASITAGDDKCYIINEKGVVVVFQAGGDEYKELCRVDLAEDKSYASIAIAENSLFIRTGEKLYRVVKSE